VNVSPFVIFALPRSRTAWTSFYLSQQTRFVGHDMALFCEKPDDFFTAFDNGMSGTVETGAVLGFRMIMDRLRGARFATIRRPINQVKRSLAQFGVIPVEGDLESKDRLLDELERVPGVLSISYDDLYDAAYRRRLFEHCLQEPFDTKWDGLTAHVNRQIDVFAQLRVIEARRNKIEALKAMLR